MLLLKQVSRGLKQPHFKFSLFFADWLHDQGRIEMDNKALELQSAEVQTRNAVAVATKEHNLAMVSASADGHYSWEGMGLKRKGRRLKCQGRSWAYPWVRDLVPIVPQTQ